MHYGNCNWCCMCRIDRLTQIPQLLSIIWNSNCCAAGDTSYHPTQVASGGRNNVLLSTQIPWGVCLCQPLLQSIIYWLIWYFVGWGGVGVFALCTHSDETCMLWFFIYSFLVSPKWWNHCVSRLVSWCLETSAETAKNCFKDTHHRKTQAVVGGLYILSRYTFWFNLCDHVRFPFLAPDLTNILLP